MLPTITITSTYLTTNLAPPKPKNMTYAWSVKWHQTSRWLSETSNSEWFRRFMRHGISQPKQ